MPPGEKFAGPSIGPVMTLSGYRANGLGRALMQESLRFTETRYPGQPIQIGAPVYLRAFYELFNFRQTGSEYDEDGIIHMNMTRDI